MKTSYQLVIMGDNVFKSEIVKTFKERVHDLGLQDDSTIIVSNSNFNQYKSNAPTVGIYFGEETDNFPDINMLDVLISDSAFILPIVGDLKSFSNQVPVQLKLINGFELKDKQAIEPLVGSIMEGLSLLRLARRLFISYRRIESRSIAAQLYEYLDQRGFDVFLDTHSVRPGEPFQDELWHRLADTDVVLLLNTPGFLVSEWTVEELAKASAMSIGVLQLIWPKHIPERNSALCFPLYLNANDFEDSIYDNTKAHLTENALQNISIEVESLRARSLAARQDNLIKEFISSAKNLNITTNLQPEKFITINRKDGKEIAVIPTVGVPQAFTYNQTEELIKRIRKNNSPEAFLIFDERNIRDKWVNHLSWLDTYLPVKSIRITEVEKRLIEITRI